MKLQLALVILMTLPALLIVGCSDSAVDDPVAMARISITSSIGGLALGGNVAQVILEISGNDFESLSMELELVEGEATAVVEVPYGADRHFRMSAYDEDGTLLYRGEKTTAVVAGAPTIVDIILLPQVSMLRAAPSYQQVLLEEQDTMWIIIHDIDSLFGLSFRVVYDTALLEINSVMPGGFLNDGETIFFNRIESDYVAITHSLVGTQSPMGVSGSGPLAEIIYTAKAVGRSPIRLTNSEGGKPDRLIDWRGEQLIDDDNFYIEPGEVEVIAP
jgi:hypothetical protein